jgi:hypothetical protein
MAVMMTEPRTPAKRRGRHSKEFRRYSAELVSDHRRMITNVARSLGAFGERKATECVRSESTAVSKRVSQAPNGPSSPSCDENSAMCERSGTY